MFGFSGGALGAGVGDAGAAEAEPVSQAGDEAVALGEAVEFLDDGAVHEAENSGVGGAGEIGHPAEQGIEEAEADAADAAFGAAGALAEDDLESFFPFVDHLRDDFGGILEIAVDEDDAVTGGVMDAGGDCGLVAEISGEGDNFEAGVFALDLGHDAGRGVAAAVVNEDGFPFEVVGVHGGGEAAAEFGEVFLLVEYGDDD